jgi:hypothetical protein
MDKIRDRIQKPMRHV